VKKAGEKGAKESWTAQDAIAAKYAAKSYHDDGAGFDELGIEYDPRGGFSASVYVHDGVYYMASRGTQPLSLLDWYANIAQALGFRTSQYEQAVSYAEQVSEATGGNVVFVGHSLGGGLASAGAYATGGNAVTFNASGLSWRYRYGGNPGNIRAHYTSGDILNFGQDASPLPNAAGGRIPHMPGQWNIGMLQRHMLGNSIW